jgi:DNA recombination protein RmuC
MITLILTFQIGLFILTALFCVLYVKAQQSKQLKDGSIEQKFQENQEKLQAIFSEQFRQLREELRSQASHQHEAILKRVLDLFTLQKNQLEALTNQFNALTQQQDLRGVQLRETVEKRLESLQKDNSQKLEQMRLTVDEKLHETLEKRLGESFKIVSERLEIVHKGLGEMTQLASGVGDLKKVLSNVKTRGTWGEVLCGNLLDQLLTKDQYQTQVKTKKNSQAFVDFAIKLPGRTDNETVWLPIDAKFPLDCYHQLLDAQDRGNFDDIQQFSKQLERRVLAEAKSIQDKYCDPPYTTDFSILYLPTEGLYAEVLRLSVLQQDIQHKHRVLLAGPTTLAALLNSLQMGFKTLAIEKQSSQVWQVLGMVKTEFQKFADILEKTHKKIKEAGNTLEDAARKTRTIERKLRDVEALPSEEPASSLLSESSSEFSSELSSGVNA